MKSCTGKVAIAFAGSSGGLTARRDALMFFVSDPATRNSDKIWGLAKFEALQKDAHFAPWSEVARGG
jgi:hypothetical protein